MTNRRVPLRQGVALVLAIVGATALGSSWAADVANQPVLTEIIVTAQKRAQNIQDVPISVIALSAQQLKDGGVTDIKNLQALTPGLTVTSTTSENVTTARIRGIGTVGDNPGLESSVGVVIDGVYRPRNGVGFGNLGEIEQIEILEGPQGELFGKNNDAGVINIVTKRPSTTFGVTAEATGGNYNDREINASVTGPLGDIAAARFYAGYQKRDGFMDINTGLGPNSDNKTDNRNFYTMRGQFLLTPSDAVNFLVIADYSKRNESCCGAVPLDDGPFVGIVNALAGLTALGGQAGATGLASPPLPHFSRQAWANQPVSQQIRDEGISGELNWDLGFGKLTSITAWRDNTIVAGNDVDYSGIDIIQAPGNEGNQTDFKQASEEIRLAGKSGPLDWLLGGFFSSEILTSNTAIYAGNAFDLYVGGVASASVTPPPLPPNFLLIPGFTGNPPGGTFVPGVSGEQDFYHQTSKSYAFFTNETYNIAQGLDLTAGLRYTGEKKTAISNYYDPDGGGGCGQLLTSPGAALNPASPEYLFLFGYGCSTLFNPFYNPAWNPALGGHQTSQVLRTSQSLDEGNVSGTVKLSYRFNDDVMAYVSWANGYKAGGFNLARVTTNGAEGALTPNLNTEFPRETVQSYEVGLKSMLADRTLRLNVSVFDQKYTNFQLNTFTGIQFVVSSIRKVESKGAEFDTTWATPLSGLSLGAGVTYAFTNITEFGDSLPLFAPNQATSLSRLNNRLSFAPLWSGVASATYSVPLTGSLGFHASVNEKYNSSYNTGSDLDPRKLQGAYGLVGARLGLGAPDGKWTVEVWGENLANKYIYQVAFDAPFQYNQIDAFLADPRTFGITVRTKF
jgi:outer membrane receptor protein involved in Fe transport